MPALCSVCERLGLTSFRDYCALLNSNKGADEIGFLINAITTNLTKFFREPHHFEHFRSQVLPELVKSAASGTPRIRVWSAGCSSGEEPYSIAMTALAARAEIGRDWDLNILATDLDTAMLEQAKAGIYPKSALEIGARTSARALFRGAHPHNGRQRSNLKAGSVARDLQALNLIKPWPSGMSFDVIFCRNVTIYFDAKTKASLINRFHSILKDGGWLYVGHSESLHSHQHQFKLSGRTIYQKIMITDFPMVANRLAGPCRYPDQLLRAPVSSLTGSSTVMVKYPCDWPRWPRKSRSPSHSSTMLLPAPLKLDGRAWFELDKLAKLHVFSFDEGVHQNFRGRDPVMQRMRPSRIEGRRQGLALPLQFLPDGVQAALRNEHVHQAALIQHLQKYLRMDHHHAGLAQGRELQRCFGSFQARARSRKSTENAFSRDFAANSQTPFPIRISREVNGRVASKGGSVPSPPNMASVIANTKRLSRPITTLESHSRQ